MEKSKLNNIKSYPIDIVFNEYKKKFCKILNFPISKKQILEEIL